MEASAEARIFDGRLSTPSVIIGRVRGFQIAPPVPSDSPAVAPLACRAVSRSSATASWPRRGRKRRLLPARPLQFDNLKQMNLKRTFRRTSFLVTRLLGNMGTAGSTPVLARFTSRWMRAKPENRWLEGLYLDPARRLDDPYRFFRW